MKMIVWAIPGSFCWPATGPRNQSFALNSGGGIAASNYSYKYLDQFHGDRRLRSIRASRCFLLDVVVRSSVDPAGHFPSNPFPGSWKLWILGAVISVVLPFWKSKWSPLLKLKNEVETVVEVVEEVTEVVEKVAEGVEKVAEDVAEFLPEGGKLREAAELIEHVAEVTAKDAHLVEGFIDKVEDVEKEIEEGVESIIKPVAINLVVDNNAVPINEPAKSPTEE